MTDMQKKAQLQAFIDKSFGAKLSSWTQDPNAKGAKPVYIVTGASFTAYDQALHGEFATHSFSRYAPQDKKYLLNNTSAIAERLLDKGCRVILHVKDSAIAADVFKHVPDNRIQILDGDLGRPEIVHEIYDGLATFAKDAPIKSVGLGLYQSFAQQGGIPFKTMDQEDVSTVEGAANKRLRFVYNMAAMSYDMLLNRQVDDLRIVSLSALASSRATYGLLADAADKYMNELAWRTFYIEGRALTGKDMTYFQVNPGITTACEVYKLPDVKKLVIEEAAADGFPFDKDIVQGRANLPQISADNVAWVSQKLMTAEYGADLNENLPPYIKQLLSGGYELSELKDKFNAAVNSDGGILSLNLDNQLPEHIFTSATTFGALPEKMEKNMYRRVSLTPLGQKF